MSKKYIDVKKLQKVPVEEFQNNTPQNPLVSICVQTYQHVNYIKQCLDGILMQKTDFDFEILLGEDESTDGTREICIEYAKKYPDKTRLFLHRRENVLYIANRPTGRFNVIYNLIHANGKYIAICEGDDYWTDPSKLQRQVDFLEENKDSVGCFHNSITVDENDKVTSKQYFKNTKKTSYTQHDALTYLASGYSTSSLVFRKNALENKIKEFAKIGSDFILDIIITEHGDLYYINETMSAYRIHSGGIWQGNNDAHNFRVKLHRYLFLYKKESYKKIDEGFIKNKIFVLSKYLLYNSRIRGEKLKFLYYYNKFAPIKNSSHYNYVFGKLLKVLLKGK